MNKTPFGAGFWTVFKQDAAGVDFACGVWVRGRGTGGCVSVDFPVIYAEFVAPEFAQVEMLKNGW